MFPFRIRDHLLCCNMNCQLCKVCLTKGKILSKFMCTLILTGHSVKYKVITVHITVSCLHFSQVIVESDHMILDWLRRFLRLIEVLTKWKRNAGLRGQICPPTLEEA